MYFRCMKQTGIGKGGDFKTKTQITERIQGKVSLKKRKLRQSNTSRGKDTFPASNASFFNSERCDWISFPPSPSRTLYNDFHSATGHVCTSTAAGIRSVLLQKFPTVPTNCISAGPTRWHHSATQHEHAFQELHSRCKQTVNHWTLD